MNIVVSYYCKAVYGQLKLLRYLTSVSLLTFRVGSDIETTACSTLGLTRARTGYGE